MFRLAAKVKDVVERLEPVRGVREPRLHDLVCYSAIGKQYDMFTAYEFTWLKETENT